MTTVLDRDLLGVSVAMDLNAFDTVIGANDWLSRRLGSAYRLCYELCIQTTHNWIARNPNTVNEKARLIFSDNGEERAALGVGLGYLKVKPWNEKIVDVRFASMKENLPLQAADLLAYETFKYWNGQFFGDRDRPARIPFRRFWGDGAMAPLRLFETEALFTICATIAMKEHTEGVIPHLIRIGEQLARDGGKSYERWQRSPTNDRSD